MSMRTRMTPTQCLRQALRKDRASLSVSQCRRKTPAPYGGERCCMGRLVGAP